MGLLGRSFKIAVPRQSPDRVAVWLRAVCLHRVRRPLPYLRRRRARITKLQSRWDSPGTRLCTQYRASAVAMISKGSLGTLASACRFRFGRRRRTTPEMLQVSMRRRAGIHRVRPRDCQTTILYIDILSARMRPARTLTSKTAYSAPHDLSRVPCPPCSLTWTLRRGPSILRAFAYPHHPSQSATGLVSLARSTTTTTGIQHQLRPVGTDSGDSYSHPPSRSLPCVGSVLGGETTSSYEASDSISS